MGAPDLLGLLSARGLTIRRMPDGKLEVSPRKALTEELRAMIRAHKPELLAALGVASEPSGMPQAREPAPYPLEAPITAQSRAHDALMRQVLAELDDRPDIDLAVVADDEIEAGAVLVAVGRRDAFVCVLRVNPERFDGIKLLELIERHTLQ